MMQAPHPWQSMHKFIIPEGLFPTRLFHNLIYWPLLSHHPMPTPPSPRPILSYPWKEHKRAKTHPKDRVSHSSFSWIPMSRFGADMNCISWVGKLGSVLSLRGLRSKWQSICHYPLKLNGPRLCLFIKLPRRSLYWKHLEIDFIIPAPSLLRCLLWRQTLRPRLGKNLHFQQSPQVIHTHILIGEAWFWTICIKHLLRGSSWFIV